MPNELCDGWLLGPTGWSRVSVHERHEKRRNREAWPMGCRAGRVFILLVSPALREEDGNGCSPARHRSDARRHDNLAPCPMQ